MALTRSDLGDLSLFRAIADAGGFRRAARILDVTPSALSHAMRGLETRLNIRLFHRTNRSIQLTEAGETLLGNLNAGFETIERGLEALNLSRDKPAGRLKISVLTDAARLLLGPSLAAFTRSFPDVRLEIAVQDSFVNIVESNCDAGIRFGDRVPEDMIAVPIGNTLRWMMVASPHYLAQSSAIDHPDDLRCHRCIGLRTGTGAIYHWELERGADRVAVKVDWAVVVNETALALEIAEGGGVSPTAKKSWSRGL